MFCSEIYFKTLLCFPTKTFKICVSQSSCTAFGKAVNLQDYFGFVKKKNVKKSLNIEE